MSTPTDAIYTEAPIAVTVNSKNENAAASWNGAAIEMAPTDLEWKLVVTVICGSVSS